MKVGQIVYHTTFGFGIVLDSKTNIKTVYFIDSDKKNIMADYLVETDEKLVQAIQDGEYMDLYDQKTTDRGVDYYKAGKVAKIQCNKIDKKINAIVMGSYNYTVTLNMFNGRIRQSCTCPVGTFCKHGLATFLKLSDEFEKLQTVNEPKEEEVVVDPIAEEYAIGERLSNLTAQLFRLARDTYQPVKALLMELKNNQSQEFILKYLKYIEKNYAYGSYVHQYKRLFQGLFLTTGLSEIMSTLLNKLDMMVIKREILNQYYYENEVYEYLKEKDGFTLAQKRESAILYYYYNNQFSKSLRMILDDIRRLYTFSSIFDEMLDKCIVDSELMTGFKNYLKSIYRQDIYITKIFKKLDTKQKLEIYKDPDINISIGLDDMKIYSVEDQLDLICSMKLDSKVLNYGLTVLGKEYVRYPKKVANMLISFTKELKSVQISKDIIEVSQKLPNCKFLTLYLTQKCFMKAPFSMEEEDYESMFEYFDGVYNIQENTDHYNIVYSLLTSSNKEIIEVVCDSKNHQVQNVEFIDDSYGKYLVKRVYEKNKDAIEEQLKGVKERITQRIYEIKYSSLIQSCDRFCNEINSKRIELSSNNKARIEYSLSDYNGNYVLSFKVGVNKMYVVRDVVEFLSLFKYEETFRYGKELELTHTFDNFKECDGVVMDLLLTNANYESSADRRYLPINSKLLKKVLFALKGEHIFINDTRYYLDLEERNCDVHIGDNYHIYSPLFNNDVEVVSLDGDLFLVDNKEKKVDIISGNKEEKKFFNFVYDNNDMNVIPIMQKFQKTIYTRYHNIITLDNSIKEEFKVSKLVINAYFDYQDKKILESHTILKDDIEVKKDNLESYTDVSKVETFEEYLNNMGVDNGEIIDDANIFSFFTMDFNYLKSLANVYLSESIQNKQVLSIGKQTVQVKYENNLMSAFLEKGQFTEEELDEIIKSIRKKKKFILLSGERIIDLSSNEAVEFEKTVTDLGLNTTKLYEEKEISFVSSLKAFAHENNCRLTNYLVDMINDIKGFKDANIDIPELSVELRPYQLEGYKWLSILSKYHMGGILADEMGLGKTLQMIAVISADSVQKPSLIVCPKSLVFNWIYEFNRFNPNIDVVEVYGLANNRQEIIKSIDYNKRIIYVTAYDSLRNDIEYYNGDFNYLVLDEAQYIKNVNAMKSQSVKSLQADHKFALTGTPIENNIIDLWSIFDFIMPGFFEELSEFKSLYSSNEKFPELVAKRVAPFILRRTKTEVLKDLPPKFERVLSAEMSIEQRKVYEAEKKLAREKLEENGKAFDILPYLMRLRQICVDPRTYIENFEGESGKMTILEELIPEYLANGHKMLIFSQFVRGLNIVEELLQKKKIKYYMLTGDTNSKTRVELVNSFNEDPSVGVFLISLKAGGTGLNLIGADTVIHLDPWWNVAAENQATDRTHRIGQKRNVEVIRLICSDSIEQRVMQLQNMKKDLIDKIISNNDESIVNSSAEDIAFILR